MKFIDDNEAIKYLKANLEVSKKFKAMREQSEELRALVNGDNFIDELIEKIEGIESGEKAKAREKYSRDIQDLFERLFQPISNIYYATGGVKDYSEITNKNIQKNFLLKIANIRDNKTLSEWVQTHAIQLMNTDPNGLIFLEYLMKKSKVVDVYPTYKSIDKIRYYESKGQLVEYVIFEPKPVTNKEDNTTITYQRIVDDEFDRTFKVDGQSYTLVKDKTFKHQFGKVPALICSNISYPGCEMKYPSIQKVIGLAKEIARDQSFLTLYKIFKANPIFWRYVTFCDDCSGTGTKGEVENQGTCSKCNGKGIVVAKSDVTDVVQIPLPTDKDAPVVTPDIAGFISPDLEVWGKFEETIEKNEEKLYKTHWGTNYGMQNVQGMKTATEVEFDKQPLENKLNVYADFAEYVEWQLSEWILNLFDLQKDRTLSKITINLGRRYIIESYDVLLDKYTKSSAAGQNSVILDKLFSEYLTQKYRNNPIDLQINLLKAKVEPYIHLPLSTVSSIFGQMEAQRKVLFQNYWQTVTDFKKNPDYYKEQFKTYFDTNKIEPKAETAPVN